MTVSNLNTRSGPYDGDGSDTTFPFEFQVTAGEQLRVYIREDGATTLIDADDYTVTVDADGTGEVTFDVAPTTGQEVLLLREVDLEQELDLINSGGGWRPETVETALDKIHLILQQLNAYSNYSLRLPQTIDPDNFDGELPDPESEKLIGWNTEGTQLRNWSATELAANAVYGQWQYDTFTGTGAQLSFVLPSSPAGLGNLDVAIAGVVKTPGIDYTLSGDTITFVAAPANGALILVRYGEAAIESALAWMQETQTATAAQVAFTLDDEYQPGTNTMAVYINGLRLTTGVDFIETSATVVTLNYPADDGDEMLFVYGNPTSNATVKESQIVDGAVATAKIADAAVTMAKLSTALQATLGGVARPAGEVAYFALAAAPTGWLVADGTAVSRATYAGLFTAIGTTYGAGNGTTTFNLPDLRGEFLRGLDGGRGVDTGRVLGSAQAAAYAAHRHFTASDESGSVFQDSDVDATHAMAKNNTIGSDSKYALKRSTIEPALAWTSSSGGTETRPRNVALLCCIKV